MKKTKDVLIETKSALPRLSASRERKNLALERIADRLLAEQETILAANRADVDAAREIFDDDEGVMNRSVMDVNGEIMVVSQFTLMASTKKGNRPSYIHAAPHSIAIPCYDRFCEKMRAAIGKDVATGEFGADMKVRLLNDGPVTIIMDTKNKE